MKYEEPGVGVRITRLGKDGEIEHLDRLKPEYYQRIEMLGKLNDRRESLKTAGDWAGLIVLADEYEKKSMPTMAAAIRSEAKEKLYGRYDTSESQQTSRSPRGGGKQKKRCVHKAARDIPTGTA